MEHQQAGPPAERSVLISIVACSRTRTRSGTSALQRPYSGQKSALLSFIRLKRSLKLIVPELIRDACESEQACPIGPPCRQVEVTLARCAW
jgi:hypothetical protein